VVFTDWASAVREQKSLLQEYLGRLVEPSSSKFAALAAAVADTGVVLFVPPGVKLEQPVHSVIWAPGAGRAFATRVLVVLGKGASATFVHEFASPTEAEQAGFHTGTLEVIVDDEAQLTLVELQTWGEHVWTVTHEKAQVGARARVDWIFGAVGSHLTKNFSELTLAGEGAEGRMSGFYFADGVQHLDHDTQQNHLAPHTSSDLLFKGALTGKSRSVWQGMIYVAPGAQRTDGYQANRNLLLSREARADSIPGLEILADDVRCTHGATVGRLEEEPLYYLMTRGIPRADAERLVVHGFFAPIMSRIPFEGVRERFQRMIDEKMRQAIR
jgi:Fe-S cluster assembly protein SufD